MTYYTTFSSNEEFAKDKLRAMLQRDLTTYYGDKFDYLYPNTKDCHTQNKQVHEGWRKKICEWFFEVVDHFQFDREVVLIALCYLDRAASSETKKLGMAINPRQYQLIAVTCFYIAMKLHGEVSDASNDSPRSKLKIQVFVELSRGLFTVEKLEEKERDILDMIGWHVNPPTSIRMISSLMYFLPNYATNTGEHLNARAEIYEISRYLAELGACDSSIVFNYKTAEIAYACLLCAIDSLEFQIPYDMRLEFTNNVLALIGLTPQSLGALKDTLKDFCPSIFSEEKLLSRFDEEPAARFDSKPSTKETARDFDKGSPICVQDLHDKVSNREHTHFF